MQLYNPFNPKNRLLTRDDIQRILEERGCSFKVRNDMLYQTAMVHSSYVKRQEYTTPTGEPTELSPRPSYCLDLFEESYERMEHLGDSILGACVSTYLMERFPCENEGFLTDLKQEIVCNEMLGRLSQKIGLDKFYIISRHNEDVCFGRTNLKKLGDIFEAFLGALWLDSQYDFNTMYKFITSLIETDIDIPKILLNNRNFKEQFQKVYQAAYRVTPTYATLSYENGIYTMVVVGINGQQLGIGSSTTKKQAEQWAAREALRKWRS
jgi:ribonuclease-3